MEPMTDPIHDHSTRLYLYRTGLLGRPTVTKVQQSSSTSAASWRGSAVGHSHGTPTG